MNPYEAQQLAMRIGFMKEPEFKAFAEEHKHDIQIFPLIYEEDKRRKSLERNQQMQQAQQGAVPPVNEQVLAKMQAPETSPMPEDVGIAQLPTGDMQFANGGIVAFADGGGTRGDPVQEFATKYRPLAEKAGAELGVDPGLIIAQWGHETGWGRGVPGKHNLGNIKGKGTAAYDKLEGSRSEYRNYESPEAFVQDYVSQIKRNWPEAMGAKRDVAAFTRGLQKGRLGAYATDPKYASKMAGIAAMLPIGAARAATPESPMSPASEPAVTTSAPEAPALAPEADGGLSTLFQRIMPIRGAPSRELPPLDFGKMATTIGKNLGVARGAGSPQAATTATVPAAPVVATPDFADSQGSIENARSTMPPKPPAAPKPDLSAAEEKKVVAAAKQAAPDDVDTSGFTREDWLTLGFSLLSSKSPRFVEALGESGLKMVAGRQARMKMGQEERKIKADIAQSEAQTRNYDALARRYANEDKPMAQYLKAVDAAIAKLTALDNFTYHDAKPQEQRRMEQAARDRVLDTYRNAYPELEDTILGKSGRELVDKYLKPQ